MHISSQLQIIRAHTGNLFMAGRHRFRFRISVTDFWRVCIAVQRDDNRGFFFFFYLFSREEIYLIFPFFFFFRNMLEILGMFVSIIFVCLWECLSGLVPMKICHRFEANIFFPPDGFFHRTS